MTLKSQVTKNIYWTTSKWKPFLLQTVPSKSEKKQSPNGRKYLQIIYMMKVVCKICEEQLQLNNKKDK